MLGEVISRLPEVCTNKLEVMRTQDKWFLSKYSLLIYRKEKTYGFKTFLKYKKWIKKIYPEDYFLDFPSACKALFSDYRRRFDAGNSRNEGAGEHGRSH